MAGKLVPQSSPMDQLTFRPISDLQPGELLDGIKALAVQQDVRNRDQQEIINRFRSLFGKLQVLCRESWLMAEVGETHWINADSVMDILTEIKDQLEQATDNRGGTPVCSVDYRGSSGGLGGNPLSGSDDI